MSAFVSQLTLVLGLRWRLVWRRARDRGFWQLGGLILSLLLVVGGVGFAFVGGVSVGANLTPGEAALGALAVFAGTHLLVLMEALARVGRGEGMAAALAHYPLSSWLIHAAETLGGASNPALLAGLAAFAGLLVHVSSVPGAALPWALLAVAWLLAVRQLAALALARLLRRRGLRELALALVSMSGLVVWFVMIWLQDRIDPTRVLAWLSEPPEAFWYLPMQWFVLPMSSLPVPALARVAGFLGAPLAVFAAIVVGADLQDRVLNGDPGGWLPRARGYRPRRWHLADRAPLSLVPPAVWATAGKELKVVRRDPFLVVMLVSQALLLIAPPLLFSLGGAGPIQSTGRAWLPLFLPVLLIAEHAPLFNVLGTEGRGLRFLAGSPAPRWQVLLGKNLAYGLTLSVFNAGVLAVAAAVFDTWSWWAPSWALLSLGLLVLLGVGNAVSAVAPLPWMGARAAAGGSKGAQAAAEGGVEPPGCGASLLRLLMVWVALVAVLPSLGLVLLGRHLGGAGLVAGLLGGLAWAVLVWLAGTGVAVGRWEAAEETLMRRYATRGAG